MNLYNDLTIVGLLGKKYDILLKYFSQFETNVDMHAFMTIEDKYFELMDLLKSRKIYIDIASKSIGSVPFAPIYTLNIKFEELGYWINRHNFDNFKKDEQNFRIPDFMETHEKDRKVAYEHFEVYKKILKKKYKNHKLSDKVITMLHPYDLLSLDPYDIELVYDYLIVEKMYHDILDNMLKKISDLDSNALPTAKTLEFGTIKTKIN